MKYQEYKQLNIQKTENKLNLFEKVLSLVNQAKNIVQSMPYIGMQNVKKKQNENNLVKAINLSLLYLSNRKNQLQLSDGEIDHHLSQIMNWFEKLNKEHHIFQDINDATSELWDNIRMIGAQRSRLLLDFFLSKGYLSQDQNNITCIIIRCVKSALLGQDFDGLEMWLEYGIGRFSSEQSLHKEIKDTSVVYIRNASQVMALHDALNIAVMLNIPKGIEVILSKYNNFLILYRYPHLFDKHTTFPFAVLRENSKSKLMEIPEFKASLSKIAVMLLRDIL